MARPVGAQARPDVGGKAQPQAHGARLAHLQRHRHGNTQLVGLGRDGIDPHRFEIATGLQRLIQLGDQFGVVGGVRFKRHHAQQQLFIEREVTAEGDIAQAVTRPADEHQLDIGHPDSRVDLQTLARESAVEEAIARGLIQNQSLGVLIAPMVEHRAWLQTAGTGYAKGRQLAGRPFDTNVDVAQANALAGLDLDHQARRCALFDTATNARLVITQGLSRLVGLVLGDTTQAPQRLRVTPIEAADITFDIGLESRIARGDSYVEFARCESPRTDQQQRQATLKMSIYAHGGGCYHGAEPTLAGH